MGDSVVGASQEVKIAARQAEAKAYLEAASKDLISFVKNMTGASLAGAFLFMTVVVPKVVEAVKKMRDKISQKAAEAKAKKALKNQDDAKSSMQRRSSLSEEVQQATPVAQTSNEASK